MNESPPKDAETAWFDKNVLQDTEYSTKETSL